MVRAGSREAEMNANLKWRLIGAGIVALGVAVGWIFGLGPLREAEAGAAQVSYEIKAFVAAPFAIVAGLFLLIGGAGMGEAIGQGLHNRATPATGRQKAMMAAVLALGGLASLAAWYWFDARLTALGYVSG
jgi:hypothetical protein